MSYNDQPQLVQIAIGIILFDEHGIILHINQGLTLWTASLVIILTLRNTNSYMDEGFKLNSHNYVLAFLPSYLINNLIIFIKLIHNALFLFQTCR